MKNLTTGLPNKYSSSGSEPVEDSADLDDLLDAHLSVCWLRPENVVWDTVASYLVRKQGLSRPTLDLGCGNGIYSFVTAGGRFGASRPLFRALLDEELKYTDHGGFHFFVMQKVE